MLLPSHRGAAADVSLSPYDALLEPSANPSASKAYGAVKGAARELLSFLVGVPSQVSKERPAWLRLHQLTHTGSDLLPAVRSLTDVQLDTLMALLLVLCFGKGEREAAGPLGTLFDGLSKVTCSRKI